MERSLETLISELTLEDEPVAAPLVPEDVVCFPVDELEYDSVRFPLVVEGTTDTVLL